jgi:hypothetical protein
MAPKKKKGVVKAKKAPPKGKVVAKKAPPKKAPKKGLPTTADVDNEEEKEEENKQQIQVKQQALVARPQQPIAARNDIPVDPYAFSPEDETNDANKKYLFSVMCRMRTDEGKMNIPLQLEIEKEATITDLKKKISHRTGGKLALNDMILTMGANVLKRSMTCRQAGIKKQSSSDFNVERRFRKRRRVSFRRARHDARGGGACLT